MEQSNSPLEISELEWKQIFNTTLAQESWGITEEDLQSEKFYESWKGAVYGAKFYFISGGPGYCGDLFVVFGDCPGEPLTLTPSGDGLAPL